MQPQAQPSPPEESPPHQLPQQQQQPVPTWSPKRHQDQQQQQQASEPDLFGDDFFSRPPTAAAAAVLDLHWDDLDDAPTIAPDKRRAMLATIAIFGVFAVAVGGFVIYTQVVMPTPVTLGATSGMLTIPQATYTPAPTPVVEAAQVVEAAPAVDTPIEVAAAATVTAAIVREPVARATVVRAHRATPAPKAERTDDDSLSAQAMRMLNSGHAADARRLAQQATQATPDRADGWIVLGAAYASLGDTEAAKTAYANCTARASGTRVATCRALAR